MVNGDDHRVTLTLSALFIAFLCVNGVPEIPGLLSVEYERFLSAKPEEQNWFILIIVVFKNNNELFLRSIHSCAAPD